MAIVSGLRGRDKLTTIIDRQLSINGSGLLSLQGLQGRESRVPVLASNYGKFTAKL